VLPIVRFALPYDESAPSKRRQRLQSHAIARLIVSEFSAPELGVRPRRTRLSTSVVPMPKASMDEDHASASGKNDVRASGKVATTYTVTVTQAMRHAPNGHLRRSADLPNSSHVTRPCGLVEEVRH
jgi:hypothetical protein